MVHGYCSPNPNKYVDDSASNPNVTDIVSIKEDFMESINKVLYSDSMSIRCNLDLSIVDSSQVPKSLQLDSGACKRTKACWRISYYNQQQKRPIYSRHLLQCFVAYAIPEPDYKSAD